MRLSDDPARPDPAGSGPPETTPPRRFRLWRHWRAIAVAAVTSVVALVALYYGATEFIVGHANRTRASVAASRASKDAASDSLAFSFLDRPRVLPELRFTDGDGRDLSLADFRDRPVLLNIWATWCVPCREEMPSLDRLQAQIGTSRLLVLPLSIDRKGLPVVKQFYDELGLKTLGIYLDTSSKAASDLNAVGVPTTLLIDRKGREIARKIGPAEWDSPEIVTLIREHLGIAASEGGGQ